MGHKQLRSRVRSTVKEAIRYLYSACISRESKGGAEDWFPQVTRDFIEDMETGYEQEYKDREEEELLAGC